MKIHFSYKHEDYTGIVVTVNKIEEHPTQKQLPPAMQYHEKAPYFYEVRLEDGKRMCTITGFKGWEEYRDPNPEDYELGEQALSQGGDLLTLHTRADVRWGFNEDTILYRGQEISEKEFNKLIKEVIEPILRKKDFYAKECWEFRG